MKIQDIIYILTDDVTILDNAILRAMDPFHMENFLKF